MWSYLEARRLEVGSTVCPNEVDNVIWGSPSRLCHKYINDLKIHSYHLWNSFHVQDAVLISLQRLSHCILAAAL